MTQSIIQDGKLSSAICYFYFLHTTLISSIGKVLFFNFHFRQNAILDQMIDENYDYKKKEANIGSMREVQIRGQIREKKILGE